MKSLANVKRGKIAAPARIVLYGQEGVGKSTFGADAPSPIFMGAERGTEHLDVVRIPHEELTSWADVMQWLDVLTKEQHPYETLVVDTLDWLEALVHDFVAKRNGVQNVADLKFAEGYKKALPEWREFLRVLDVLRDRRGMHVVLLAHAKVAKYDRPGGESWDRWSLKLHSGKSSSASDLVKEWANEVLFAAFDEQARGKGKWDRKAIGSGRRVLHTQRSPSWDAKNRHDLPAQMKFEWREVWRKLSASSAVTGPELKQALDDLLELAGELGPEEGSRLRSWVLSLGSSVARATLAKAGNRARVLLEEAKGQGGTDQDERAPARQSEPAADPAPAAPQGAQEFSYPAPE